MSIRGKKWGLRFDGCRLGLSTCRLREHIELGQINPFAPVTPASAAQPQCYVDIVEVSGVVQTLTGRTLADLLAGNYGDVCEELAHELLRHVDGTSARRWLAEVGEQLRKFSQQRALRNRPESFLPTDSDSPLRVRHLHSALFDWLKAHGKEKASVAQWSGRLENLASKGLRDEELVFSGLSKRLKDLTAPAVNGNALSTCLNYDALRLSVIPVIQSSDKQIEFIKVPVNATLKRIKPKLKSGLVTHPQWRDRALGYCVDEVAWDDLLGPRQAWMAFTHRGEPVVSSLRPSGLCQTHAEALALASSHAEHIGLGAWNA